MASYICPNCTEGNMDIFHEENQVPTNSCILMATRDEAINYPRGDIKLGFCNTCGFVGNVAFDKKFTEYSSRYEETQGFSSTFNTFHKSLVERLIDKYDIRNKDVIEIGCGKGEFLALICELGNNRGIGFDPGFDSGRLDKNIVKNVKVIKDFYSNKYATCQGDFICCKMTLEHIPNTLNFVQVISRSIDPARNTVVFFQVPDAVRIFNDCSFEDIYYEHCSYFTAESLSNLFRRSKLKVISVENEYADQYLTIEALPQTDELDDPSPKNTNLDALRSYIAEFPGKYEKKLSEWKTIIEEAQKAQEKIVLWGSGSKAVTFLKALNISNELEFVVDINPHRHGFYMPGTGHKIIGPVELQTYKPDIVIIMNSIYREEISSQLNEMEFSPRIMTL